MPLIKINRADNNILPAEKLKKLLETRQKAY
jgi:hypothetical protein